jgi:hypothetical protein
MLILFNACEGTVQRSQSTIQRPIDELYQGAGVEKFFLPNLPAWANFSESAGCHRPQLIRYLDLAKIAQSYTMNYDDVIKMQITFNRRYQSYVANARSAAIMPKDETFLFYNVLDQIQAGVADIEISSEQTIHLIWIDSFIQNKNKIKLFKKFYAKDSTHSAMPYWVSVCYSEKDIQAWARKNRLDLPNRRVISAEAFVAFDKILKPAALFGLDFSSLFKQTKNLILFTDQKTFTPFLGVDKVRSIE